MTRFASFSLALLLLTSPLLAAEPAKVPIILDTALGNEMDDALALALATALPEIDLKAVTTVRKDAEVRAWMACRFLHAVDRRMVPVAFGRGEQPPGDVGPRFQYRYHPALIYNRMGKPAKETAVELMARELAGKKKEVTIVCTGPLTNVAQLLKEHPEAAEGIKQLVISASSYVPEEMPVTEGESTNLRLDLAAARAVLAAKVDKVIVPLYVAFNRRLSKEDWRKLLAAKTLRTMQLEQLWQLSDEPQSPLADTIALAWASGDPVMQKYCTVEPRVVSLSDKGVLTIEAKGASDPAAVQVVTNFGSPEPLVTWLSTALTRDKPALPRENKNFSKLVERGNFPNRVHAFEDYNTDIERRWWMAGREELKIVSEGGKRACRSVLTQDFDDRQGDLSTMYNSVTFNPVPGPPMGKKTRLAFKYYLKGTSELRIQLYSLTNGYHRYLTLKDLPQEKWQSGCVDMTEMRRPDGEGGPLSENERIDDVQFYVDPRAEVIIDEWVLYDAAAEGETRPFPKQFHFTGWFDSGKQGNEWPGTFEIVPDAGYFWKAAKSVPVPGEPGSSSINVSLRGPRLLGATTKLDFQGKLTGGDSVKVVLLDTKSGKKITLAVEGLKADVWTRHTVTFQSPMADPGAPRIVLDQADAIQFIAPAGSTLLVDDLLLYEP